jgi:hypothetical protein
MFFFSASGVPYVSICTEWSMIRWPGHSGSMMPGSLPCAFAASRIAAKSTNERHACHVLQQHARNDDRNFLRTRRGGFPAREALADALL